jgi:hypothetical protein
MTPPGNISSLNVQVHHPEVVVVVECIPLAHILNKAHVHHVNYFLLDVEGGELEVLKSIHWHHVIFDVLCVETDPVSDEVTVKESINHNDVLITPSFFLSLAFIHNRRIVLSLIRWLMSSVPLPLPPLYSNPTIDHTVDP